MLSKFLQNQEQMRLNIGKKLKTASLNSRFTGSKKEECTSTCSLLKNFETLTPKVTVKGGESSSQFQWFAIAKIEL